jgi:hypothetical protein
MPNELILRAPLSGVVYPLERVPDPVFAQKLTGDGLQELWTASEPQFGGDTNPWRRSVRLHWWPTLSKIARFIIGKRFL